MGSTFRKGSKETGQSAGMSNNQGGMAQGIFDQTEPLRKQTFGDLTSFLNGGTPSFLVGPTQDASSQIAQLGRQVQENGVRGGQLKHSLAMLPMQRMGMLDQLRSGMFNTALNTGMGGAQAGINGLSGAASNLNSLGQQRQQQNMQFQQGLGGLAGSLGKAMMI